MHDFKGQPVKSGDIVLVPCRVELVFETDNYCNVNLVSLLRMPPQLKYPTNISAINTRQTIRANDGDDIRFSVSPDGSIAAPPIAAAAASAD